MTSAVLLYQNDASISAMVQEMLMDEGHPVIICGSLAEVQARSRMDPTAMALIDAWGPSYSVLADSERQDICALAAQMPTVMLTARSWAQGVRADELGLLALLPKPIELDQLVATVSQQVARLRQRSQEARGRSLALQQRSNRVLARLRDVQQLAQTLHPKDGLGPS